MASFRTNPVGLEDLLRKCEKGAIKLPEFQRSWVWDEDRIRSLMASISLAFPVGVLMTLESGGAVEFKERPVQGAPGSADGAKAECLLLDGQQRMTSLYQACIRDKVVETVTARRKRVSRWFYIDIEAALNPAKEREEAIIGVPEDRILKRNFGREIVCDLSSPEREYELGMFPANRVFDWDVWQDGLYKFCYDSSQLEKISLFLDFKNKVLQNFKSYQIPVIDLGKDTSREAVCLVFEKVNTGGKPLDAFELVTAMYASQGFELRKDWLGEHAETGRYRRLAEFGRAAGQKFGPLEKVASTDFLQSIALLQTKERRAVAAVEGQEGHDLPPVRATRQSLLNLPLDAYSKYSNGIEEGFKNVVKFLRLQYIYRVLDIPYQSQLVPLAAIFSEIGDRWQHATIREQIARWFWNGVFGELYGSTTESRFARDVVEVPAWLNGGDSPSTILNSVFRADRLRTMSSRVSAAYKGVNALLMKEGAQDFRSGQAFDQTIFFDENVDIHHIFPQNWCKKQGIDKSMYDSIINKTPLSSKTNRILGGDAPSVYLARLERGAKNSPPIAGETIDASLHTHLIDPALLRADDFDGFFRARQSALLNMIEQTGQTVYGGEETDEPEVDLPDEIEEMDLPVTAAE